MFAQVQVWWERIRDSLWFIPTLLTIGAIFLALAMVEVDRHVSVDAHPATAWVFGGGSEGARGVLSAIAGSLITVTGVVFSVTIVALQLASSQYTPRVLRTFMADPANQTVLGMFIATFTYTLLVMRTIRATTEDADSFIPAISVTLAIVLALVSIGFLIFFIDHAARSIQISTILDRVAKDTHRRIDRLFPEPIGRPIEDVPPSTVVPPSEPAVVRANHAGYLQMVDEDALFGVAEKEQLVIRMEPHVGEFLAPGDALGVGLAVQPSRRALHDENPSRVRNR